MSHCTHFGQCGGCAADDPRAIDKPALLRAALARAGFTDAPIAPLIEIPPGARRRVDLGVARIGAGISLGLHRARGAEVVDMRQCALLRPELLCLLPPLRALLRSLSALRGKGAVVINRLDNGPDILLRLDGEASLADRRRIVEFAKAQGAPRISLSHGAGQAEPVVILEPPCLRFAGVPVTPPPGGFLQASAAGEGEIIRAVLAGLGKLTRKSRVAELFAGAGTLSFALAALARVEAYEGDAAAAAAGQDAARAAGLAGRVSFTRRDLHRRPLQQAEMAGAAAVVLDPPFAGAPAQMRFIAASEVARVIYVSCNPEALAADAAVLRRAGYSLRSAVPIDQFPYSENLESVAVFAK